MTKKKKTLHSPYDSYDYREVLGLRLKDLMDRDNLTWRELAKTLKLKSSGHLLMVAKGERPLPVKLFSPLCDLLEFSVDEAAFFKILHSWNTAKPLSKERKTFEEKVFSHPDFQKSLAKRIGAEDPSRKGSSLGKDYLEYFSNAMCILVKELIGSDLKIKSSKDITKYCKPYIGLKQASEILAVLERLSIIEKKSGIYTINQEMEDLTSDELDQTDFIQFQRKVNSQWLDAAKVAWESFSEEERTTRGFTLALTEQALLELVEKAENAVADLAYDAHGKEGQKNRIAHVQILVTPLNKKEEK